MGEFATLRLREWEQGFKVKYIGDASLIKKVNNEVRWEIEAQSKDKSSMQLQDNFQLGNRKLNSQLTWEMSKLGKGTMFFQGHGLIRLNREQVEDFEWWKKNKGGNSNSSDGNKSKRKPHFKGNKPVKTNSGRGRTGAPKKKRS